MSRVAIAPDGRTAYSASRDGTVIAWDLIGDRRLDRPFSAPPRGTMDIPLIVRGDSPSDLAPQGLSVPYAGLAVAATRDGSSFAVPDDAGYFDVYDSRTLKPARRIPVFSALSGKIYLTALNATDFVPITFDFADRIAADNTTVATATVVTILSDPDVREFMRQGLMYWWDPLNAAAAITGRLVTYERTRLSVVQSGVEAGRTVVHRRGARIRLGVAADAQAFENHFLASLTRPDG